tara:strand:+ start:175 stop:501 length:327 start_codon:yes stop_codon:yes gene_type:complete
MDFKTGRPNHIEDYLVSLHTNQWFGWSDSKNKVYANLIIHDASKDKPTEQECTDGLAKMQSDFDALAYQRNRRSEYPSIVDQLDDIYHNGIDGWKTTIKAIKDKYPKE